MFFYQLIEDYTFDDVKFVYDNDKYFLYVKDRYDLSSVDESNFKNLLDGINHPDFIPFITSLEVITLRKNGLLSRVEIVDVEDEARDVYNIEPHVLVGYPVDMYFSSDNKRALRLIISLLLELNYYRDMDVLTKSKSDEGEV